MAQKDSQENLMELRMMESRLEGLGRQKEMVAARIAEIESTAAGIEEISKAKGDAMFHVGGEAFVSAKPSGDGKVVVVIGADVAMEKTVPEAKKLLDSRKEEAENVMKHLESEIAGLTKKLEMAAMSMQAQPGK